MESVVKEIKERCTERGEKFPCDLNQTQQRQPLVSNTFKKAKIMKHGSTN